MILGMWMTSCPEAMACGSWVFWKKQSAEIWSWTKRVDFWTCVRPVQLWTAGCARVGWASELKADDGRTVSIEKLCLSLSSYRKPNLKDIFNGYRWHWNHKSTQTLPAGSEKKINKQTNKRIHHIKFSAYSPGDSSGTTVKADRKKRLVYFWH